eukprot:159740-Pyramimonas_sp.AAC.1
MNCNSVYGYLRSAFRKRSIRSSTNAYGRLWKDGVTDGCVQLLESLYFGQPGRVRTDRMSKEFDILRATKQGDPLSSSLFNA